jgi:hypothetical protein
VSKKCFSLAMERGNSGCNSIWGTEFILADKHQQLAVMSPIKQTYAKEASSNLNMYGRFLDWGNN